jgi:hypothetical protein
VLQCYNNATSGAARSSNAVQSEYRIEHASETAAMVRCYGEPRLVVLGSAL